MGIEIERKYLIRKPDTALLDARASETWDITQTYLLSEPDCTERVRLVRGADGERYFHTVKRRRSVLSCEEMEEEITEAAYETFLLRRDPARCTIEKRRWRIPYEKHLLEIDVYPFWRDAAVLEIELADESDIAACPDWVEVLADVTADVRFKNVSIAKQVPAIGEFLQRNS